jgi:transketolase
MASGSEVNLIVEAGARLAAEAINVRLVSFPSWELFSQQDKDYREKVLPERVKTRLAVEAGISLGWERWVGEKGSMVGVDRYGVSAPFEIIYREFGLSVDNIIEKAKRLLN